MAHRIVPTHFRRLTGWLVAAMPLDTGTPHHRPVLWLRSVGAAVAARCACAVVVTGLIFTSCSTSSDPANDVDNSGTSYSETEDRGDRDTVVPPVDQGVGGGAPTENLNDDESNDEVDGDRSPDEL